MGNPFQGKNKALTDEQIKRGQKMLDQGYNVEDVAERFGKSKQFVYTHFKVPKQKGWGARY
jgi:transposase